MNYTRAAIEVESPEEHGYATIKYNLSESSCTDRSLHSLPTALPDLTLLYTAHRGSDRLRALIASGGSSLSPDDVLVTPGASGALFIVATSLLSAKDHLVVLRPNYATNIDTPKAIGCAVSYVDLVMEEGWGVDVGRVEAAVQGNTKLISITCPHNPTGTNLGLETLKGIVEVARRKGCVLLVDETYREVDYGVEGGKVPIAAELGTHVVSVGSMSKSYGVPGIRIGWVVVRDGGLREKFLAAKEQICITGSVVDEWVAEQVLERKEELLKEVNKEMVVRRAIMERWMEREREVLEWERPVGGVVCFVRMKKEPAGGTKAFYERLLKKYGTYVGPGHWFEQPDTYFRIGFGWTTEQELEMGLEGISKALRDS